MTEAARGKKVRVLLWGPFPGQGQVFGGGIGGYARCNSQMLRSFLADIVELIPLEMTVPKFRHPVLARLLLPLRMLMDVVTTTRALLRHRPDVVHITALYWRSIYREAWMTWLAKRLGAKVVYDIRAGTFESFCRQSAWGTSRILDYIMRNASDITVEGQGYVQFVRQRYQRKATWVPNFFLAEDLDAYPPAPLRKPAPGERFRLVFVGYLIPQKGVDTLLEASWQLSRKFPVELTLIGAPSLAIEPLLARYQARQSETFRLTATGRLDFAEVLARLQQQHLFVFPSRFFGEGHTNAVTEAMAMGLPVVATRHGFLPDVVTPECGVIVEPGDLQGLTEVIAALLSDWERLTALGRGARERIRTAFTDQSVLAKTAAIYAKYAR